MKMTWITAVCALGAAATALPMPSEPAPILTSIEQELRRNMTELSISAEPPYYLSYEITEKHVVLLRASFGALTENAEDRTRLLDIDLRVGSRELDNTHPVRGEGESMGSGGTSFVRMPLDDEPGAIRWLLWYHTDKSYKRALERLTRVRTNVRVKVEAEDASPDMSREEPVQHLGESQRLDLDRELWKERLKRLSAPFAGYGDIYQAQAVLYAATETRWYVNSEGTRIRTSQPHVRLVISALTKADDGMELPRYDSFFATSAARLPEEDTLLDSVNRMIADLLALRQAPLVDPYVGPAILSGRASGVFFHEIFGHRVEGHRQKDEAEGQTFKEMVGEVILPRTFSVFFDPELAVYAGQELAGHYGYDNQGVPGQRVTVVENGFFKGFLMSRSPIEGFEHSNGHGRKQAGFLPVARQSNLVVEAEDSVSAAELKEMLIALLHAQGRPWGLRFEDVQGGFTLTGRTIPNAFNVLPIKVFRVYPDGREELVRGVDLIGTPLAAFSKIVAADDQVGVFNGVCGAESGGVPVAAVSPGILVSELEVQKKRKSQERLPILPAPFNNSREEE
jgi:predicted Zn-dependent protease